MPPRAVAVESQSALNPLESYFEELHDGPGLWKWWHYFNIYHRHLSRFMGRPVTVVEIGVFSGGSIRMWQSYLGPAAHIYGVDIEPACKAYEGPGVDIVIGDQAGPGSRRTLRTAPRRTSWSMMAAMPSTSRHPPSKRSCRP